MESNLVSEIGEEESLKAINNIKGYLNNSSSIGRSLCLDCIYRLSSGYSAVEDSEISFSPSLGPSHAGIYAMGIYQDFKERLTEAMKEAFTGKSSSTGKKYKNNIEFSLIKPDWEYVIKTTPNNVRITPNKIIESFEKESILRRCINRFKSKEFYFTEDDFLNGVSLHGSCGSGATLVSMSMLNEFFLSSKGGALYFDFQGNIDFYNNYLDGIADKFGKKAYMVDMWDDDILENGNVEALLEAVKINMNEGNLVYFDFPCFEKMDAELCHKYMNIASHIIESIKLYNCNKKTLIVANSLTMDLGFNDLLQSLIDSNKFGVLTLPVHHEILLSAHDDKFKPATRIVMKTGCSDLDSSYSAELIPEKYRSQVSVDKLKNLTAGLGYLVQANAFKKIALSYSELK